MTNDEAKFILRAYRPDGRDADDPLFAAALRQARADPSLGAWFAAEQAHDRVLAVKLREIAPPAGLRESILAGARASATRSRARRWTVWAAVAAGLLVALSLVIRQALPGPGPDELTRLALADARELTPHHGAGGPARELSHTLASQAGRLPRSLPIDYRALAGTGCRTLPLSGDTVLEVCFNHQGTWLHCYVARLADFPGMRGNARPAYAAAGDIHAVSWSDGSFRYVVAGPVSQQVLEELL